MINVHSSLLPKWRGAAPIVHAIANGDKTLGCSVMVIRPHRFDTGPILIQKSLEFDNNSKLPDISKDLAKLGAHLLEKCLENLDFFRNNPREQNESLISYGKSYFVTLMLIISNRISFIKLSTENQCKIFSY